MKITPRDPKANSVIKVKTNTNMQNPSKGYKWWNAANKREMANEIIATGSFLKEQQQFRYRQSAIYSRLYGNMSLFNFVGSSLNKFSMGSNLPADRPTMNVVQSCVDTLTSRISQSRPKPIFLTDGGDYKERNLAKQMNNFISGEFYQTKAYHMGPLVLRDSSVLGTGIEHIFEKDQKVCTERVMLTEMLVDPNDALYGDPRQLYRLKLVDRDILADQFPNHRSDVEKAEQAFPDLQSDSTKTVADQVMLIEAWHLPSSRDAKDGMHSIACSSGLLFEEPWDCDWYPFSFLHYSPRILGFWGQGLAEQLMGTQTEINKLLMTISQAINLVGVPRVFVEDGSKVVKAHLNNQVGAIVTFRGTKPQYEVAPCIPAEVYAQLQRLIEYAYQQSGVSALAATSQKPAGLNSGEAIRNFDDLQSDRFASLSKRYEDYFIDRAYKIIYTAREIAKRDGKYQTVFPDKTGTKLVDLPNSEALDDPFVIQCFDISSLPKDPSGRLQKVTEMAQAGMINMQEARRLLDYPDLEQVERLANAAEERILQILDEIVEKGKYTPPDPFMDLQLAMQLVTQYYNLYIPKKLEESRAQLLRDFSTQIQALMQAATPPAPPQGPNPQAVPQPLPQSPLLPNAPQG